MQQFMNAGGLDHIPGVFEARTGNTNGMRGPDFGALSQTPPITFPTDFQSPNLWAQGGVLNPYLPAGEDPAVYNRVMSGAPVEQDGQLTVLGIPLHGGNSG